MESDFCNNAIPDFLDMLHEAVEQDGAIATYGRGRRSAGLIGYARNTPGVMFQQDPRRD